MLAPDVLIWCSPSTVPRRITLDYQVLQQAARAETVLGLSRRVEAVGYTTFHGYALHGRCDLCFQKKLGHDSTTRHSCQVLDISHFYGRKNADREAR